MDELLKKAGAWSAVDQFAVRDIIEKQAAELEQARDALREIAKHRSEWITVAEDNPDMKAIAAKALSQEGA